MKLFREHIMKCAKSKPDEPVLDSLLSVVDKFLGPSKTKKATQTPPKFRNPLPLIPLTPDTPTTTTTTTTTTSDLADDDTSVAPETSTTSSKGNYTFKREIY